jgi:helicase MOV-10
MVRSSAIIEDLSYDTLLDVKLGDYVFLDDGIEDKSYEGRIHGVNTIEQANGRLTMHLKLRLPETFNLSNGNTFKLRPKLNRIPIRRALHGLNTPIPNLARLLFPSAADFNQSDQLLREETGTTSIVAYNENILEDEQQRLAVLSILHRRPGDVPFIIYGP